MRLSLKLLLIFELVLLLGVFALVVPVWSAMHDQVIEDMQNELKAIASTGALAIDGGLHGRIRQSADADSEAFRQLRKQLARVQQANHVPFDHIYTFYREGDRVRFAVMLHPEPFVGDPYTLQPLMRPVFEQGTTEATELYEDENGQWISAYAPIRDTSGAVVGVLEVDKDSRMYLAKFREVTRLVLVVGLVALAISSLLGWIVLQWIVIRPMNAVHGGMLALSRQDFQHRVRLQTGDEFEELGGTFNNMAKQLNVASRVQSGLFPATLPEHPGYRIAACSAPCDATGGDYYDAFTLEDGRIVILVADVSGHGLGPSLLMASCRSALRVLSSEGLSPCEILEKLDARMSEDLPEGRFITMIFGLLDSDGVLTFSNAGHGPAMVVANGEVHQLSPHTPPIGLGFLGAPGESTVHLAPGDRVFLASDGVSEAASPDDEEFGIERIGRIVSDRSLTSPGVLKRLNEALAEHSRGTPRTDDVTMLCVDRLGA
jgi:serine phosphatase RsbU (regulator of sigma subunit)